MTNEEYRQKLCADLRHTQAFGYPELCKEAADEIDRLAKELAKAHSLCGDLFKAAYDKERDAAIERRMTEVQKR